MKMNKIFSVIFMSLFLSYYSPIHTIPNLFKRSFWNMFASQLCLLGGSFVVVGNNNTIRTTIHGNSHIINRMSINTINAKPFTQIKELEQTYQLTTNVVSINNPYGPINIDTDNTLKKMIVKAIINAAEGHLEDIDPFNFDGKKLHASSNKNIIYAELEYQIQLPKDIRIDCETINGDTTVLGSTKNTQTNSTNGKTKIISSGNVIVHGTNGPIEVTQQSDTSTTTIKSTNSSVNIYNANKTTIDITNGNASVAFNPTSQQNAGSSIKVVNGSIKTKNAPADLVAQTVNGSKNIQ